MRLVAAASGLFWLSGCVSSPAVPVADCLQASRGDTETRNLIKGALEATVWAQNKKVVQHYRLEPHHGCEFRAGAESILTHFLSSQNSRTTLRLAPLDPPVRNLYRAVDKDSDFSTSVLLHDDIEGIDLWFGDAVLLSEVGRCYGMQLPQQWGGEKRQLKTVPEFYPNPLLFSVLFRCGERGEKPEPLLLPGG